MLVASGDLSWPDARAMNARRTILALAALITLTALGWWWQRDPHSTAVLTLGEAAAEDAHDPAGLGPATEREAESPLQAERRALEQPPTPPRVEQSGTVTTPDDRPLAGVRLMLRDEVLLETQSDADGRFHFTDVTRPRNLIAELEGWMQIAEPQPRAAPDGGLAPLHIVMAPLASLQLRVVDSNDEAVTGLNVWIDISSAEPHGRKDSGHRSYQPPRASRTTSEAGVAVFQDVAANCRLSIHAQRGFEWVRAGVLADRGAGAVPIVLEPGEERHLVARLGSRVTLEGLVLEANGEPSPKARVAVYALDQFESGRPDLLAWPAADESGRFNVDLVARSEVRHLLLTAQSTIGEIPPKGMFGGRTLPDPLCVASTEVMLHQHGQAVDRVRLIVQPLHKIAGRLVDAQGASVGGRVRLFPHHEPPLIDRLISGWSVERDVSRNGEFRFIGVLAGQYDIVAGARGRHTVRVPDIEAGTEDLVIVIPSGTPATVEVEVHCSEPLEQLVILCSRLEPLPGIGDDAPVLPTTADYREPVGWPAPALGLWYGSETYSGPLGSALFSSGPLQAGSTTKTLELDEGLYWIGAKARTESGAMCFPIGTGLVRVTRGEHRLRFHLVPATSLRGSVRGAQTADALCVALAAPDGRLIALDVRRVDMHDLTDLSAAGRFELHQVPTGHYELRVGTADELRAGSARVRHAVELVAGEVLEVELKL
jgi:hypothetical protein